MSTGRRGLLLVLALVLLGWVAMRSVAEPMRVSSSSMEPTVADGDEVLVAKALLGGRRGERGDVVVLHRPGDGALVVKRVAATAGDRLAVRDGHLVVNGARVEEPYVDPASVDGTYFGPVRVPPGRVFVLGDHRAVSQDSRDFGAVAVEDLVGTVVATLWSARHPEDPLVP